MNYTEALKLEVSILEATLQRSRCGHQKAKYFQRTSMALRAILKTDLVDLYDTAESWKNAIVNRKKQYDQESRNITKKRKQQQLKQTKQAIKKQIQQLQKNIGFLKQEPYH